MSDKEGEAAPAPSYAFDAFFSYAGDPDRYLVREVESFLEGLHRDPLIPAEFRRELEACVDGSDFKRPRTARPRATSPNEADDPVFQLIVEHLLRSRWLVVFVGPSSRDHRWLNQELAWWLRYRGTEHLQLVLSHGTGNDPLQWMPAQAVAAGLDRHLWFDFRASQRAARGSDSNRIYEEERLRLAATLIGDEVAASNLVKGWKQLNAVARKIQRWRNGILAGLAVVLVGSLGWAVRVGLDRAEESRVGLWTTLASVGATLDPDRRLDALSYGLAALKTRPNAAAFAATAESLQILAAPDGQALVDPTQHAIDAVRFIADGRWLASAGFDQQLRLLSPDELKPVAVAPLQGRAVSLTDLPDKAMLLVTTRKGVDLFSYGAGPQPQLKLIGRAKVAAIQTGENFSDGQTFAAVVDQQNDMLLVSSTNGRIEWYQLAQARVDHWEPVHAVNLQDTHDMSLGIFGMALVSQKNRLVVASISGEVQCLDPRSGKRTAKPFKHVAEIFGMAAHEPSSSVVAADSRGGWLSVDAVACRAASVREPPTPFGSVAPDNGGVLASSPQVDAARTAISFSPDGQFVAVTGHDGTARLYLAATGALMAIAPHSAMTRGAALSADHRRMAVGTGDGLVALWRVDTGAERLRLAGVDTVAVDATSQRLLAVGEGSAQEIDLVTGTLGPPSRSEVFKGFVHAVAGSRPGSYAVWHPESGEFALLRRAPDNPQGAMLVDTFHTGRERRARVHDIAALADGNWLLAEHGEGMLLRTLDAQGSLLKEWPLQAPTASFASSDALIAVVDSKGMVQVWRPDGQLVERMAFGPGAIVAAGGHTLFVSGKRQSNRLSLLCDFDAAEVQAPSASSAASAIPPGCRQLEALATAHRARLSNDGNTLALSLRLADDDRPDSGELAMLRRGNAWRLERMGASGRLDALSFSADSRWLAVGGRRGGSLWRVGEAGPSVSLPTPSPVIEVAITGSEAQGLGFASIDGLSPSILRLWDGSAKAFIARGCGRIPPHRAMPQSHIAELPSLDDICRAPAAPGFALR